MIGFLPSRAAKPKEKSTSTPYFKMIDYQHHLNSKYKKILRPSTEFIIVHTSEAGLESTLRTLSQGKDVGPWRTVGGHSHFAISRDGTIYKIMDHRYRADHVGVSMWNGIQDISSHSVGIELVGYHDDVITDAQYQALSKLLKMLQKFYRIPDRNILTHCQVCYGKPNEWVNRSHRGRKKCALNFQRERAELNDQWAYDPDVREGRLKSDREIQKTFYSQVRIRKPRPEVKPEKVAEPMPQIISKENSAWNIAGEDYNSSETVYILPDECKIRGDAIANSIGWNRIPIGTKVLLNQPLGLEKNQGPIFHITRDLTAWSYAGKAYKFPSTFYFYPDGQIISGNQVKDWDTIPIGVSMILNYQAPIQLESMKPEWLPQVVGNQYTTPTTLYFIPKMGLIGGDQINNLKTIPNRTQVFFPRSEKAPNL